MERKRDNRHLAFLALVGMVAFVVEGFANGLILTRFEMPLGSVVEGAIWGSFLGYFVRDRFQIWKTVVAAIVANVISYFPGTLVGFIVPIPRFVTYMIMGILMGLIFGGILAKMRGAILFSTIGALLFLLGGFLFDTLSAGFYNLFVKTWGDNGWIIFAPAFIGIFKGLALGLALGLLEQREK